MPINPAISIVMPFRNAQDTLSACLDSIQRQTFRDFEAVLVDDGSEDRSADIVRERTRLDRRFLIVSDGRVGLVAALNLGIGHSRADLICRMDADDIMHPERLKEQYRFLLNNPDIAVAGSKIAVFPRNMVRGGYLEYARWLNSCLDPYEIASNIFVESPLAHPSIMMRRSAVDSVGGYHDGAFPEDYDLWLRLNQSGHRMAKVPRMLLAWRESPDRTSRTDDRYNKESFDRLRARYLAKHLNIRSGRDVVVWGGGRPTRLRVKLLLDQGIKISAWVDVHPRRIGSKIWGIPVHSYKWLDRDDKPFVLAYVANHGARVKIAAALREWGYVCDRDYLAVG